MALEMDAQEFFGNIDIYLFDQILKGQFERRRRILDAGCGNGRNLIYFLRQGFDVCAVDESPTAVSSIRELALDLAPELADTNFQQASIEELPFPESSFDAVLSSAVLHFARDEDHFSRMLDSMWRVLRSNGLFFCRLASSIGLEDRIERQTGRRYRLPDGSDRFLVDLDYLLTLSDRLGGQLLEPIKTTNVQNLRCMTTWCLEKKV